MGEPGVKSRQGTRVPTLGKYIPVASDHYTTKVVLWLAVSYIQGIIFIFGERDSSPFVKFHFKFLFPNSSGIHLFYLFRKALFIL